MFIIEKEIKGNDKARRERIEKYQFFYENIENNIYFFDYKKETETLYPEIEIVFSKIKYDMGENKVTNLEEILENWSELYNKYLFSDNRAMCELVIDLNRYYSLKENIDFLINNFAFFPFFKLIFSEEKEFKEFKFYNILDINEIEFDINKRVTDEKEKRIIKIEGKPNTKVNLVDIKKELREALDITPDKILKLEIYIEGEGVLIGDKIENFDIGVYLKTNGYIDKIYKIEIGEESK